MAKCFGQLGFSVVDFLQFSQIFLEFFAKIATQIAFVLILQLILCEANGPGVCNAALLQIAFKHG
jgi:hypothetical protein